MGVDCCVTKQEAGDAQSILTKISVQLEGGDRKDDSGIPLENARGINGVKSICVHNSKPNPRARATCVTQREQRNGLERLRRELEERKDAKTLAAVPEIIYDKEKEGVRMSEPEAADRSMNSIKLQTCFTDTDTKKKKKHKSTQKIHKPLNREEHSLKITHSLKKPKASEEHKVVEKIIKPPEISKKGSSEFLNMLNKGLGSFKPTDSFFKTPTNFKIEPLHFRTERRKNAFEERYIIEDTIGKGTFGEVKRIQDKDTGLYKSLKIISKANCQMTDHFADEIEIIKKLVIPV